MLYTFYDILDYIYYDFTVIITYYVIFMFKLGVQTGGCGVVGIRMRPALIFQPHHAHMFIDRLRQVLSETK